MPFRLIISAMTICVMVLASCHEASATIFFEPSVSELIDKAHVVALGKWLYGTQKSEDSVGTTEFEILKVARQPGANKPKPSLNDDTLLPTDFLPNGVTITLPRYIKGNEQGLFLLTGSVETGVLSWSDARPVTKAGFEFASNIPAPKSSVEVRVKYFARYFDSRDRMIADEAGWELRMIGFAELAGHIDEFPRIRLRRLVTAEQPSDRIGLYALLLGLKGTSEDADILERIILNTESRSGIKDVISGYLLLKGEAGLDIIDRVNLKCEGVESFETYPSIGAINFMRRNGSIPVQRLQQSLYLMLDNPNLADAAIGELRGMKDWSVQDRLIELQSDILHQHPKTQEQIALYMMAATDDVDPNASEPPPHVLKAGLCLHRLKIMAPETFERAREAQRWIKRFAELIAKGELADDLN